MHSFSDKINNFLMDFLQIYAGDVITIRFTPKSLLRLCLDATINYSKELESEFGTLPLLMQKLLNSKKIILNNKNSEDS